MENEKAIHVLVIDDEEMIRLMIEDYLEDSDYVVSTAKDGEEGLEIFREQHPDVVLVDLRMPKIDGLEVLATITQDSPETPVIIVSGTGVIRDVVEALRLGAWDYLTKPIEDMEMLGHAVQRSLERARLLRENRNYRENLEEQVRQRTQELQQSEEKYRTLAEELEQRVTQRTAELETVNRELKDFAYIVSHDLKAPLRGISRLAHWIVQDYAEAFDEQGKEMINLLIGRVKRTDKLIDGILEYSRIGRIVRQDEQIDLNTLVNEVIDTISPPEQVQIVFENPLPVIHGDPIRIAQIFQNLIENAVKFMNRPHGEIKVGWNHEGSCWKFYVADNGPGIAKQHHEKIFQIFQTLTSRDERESTGVGLTIVKKIVEFYGGKIWVESAPGKGSIFFFTLPQKQESLLSRS